jgi:capsular exopolysaccharide synthesis family protein
VSFRITNQKNSQPDQNKHFNHYKRLFLHNTWFIVPVAAFFFTLWIIFIYRYGIIRPVLKATSVLQFDNPDNISAVTERVPLQADTRAVLIKSRSFLEQVAQDLSLRLRTGRNIRSEIFDSVRVASDAPEGDYEMKISDTTFTLMYREPESKGQFTTLLSGNLADLKHVKINNISLYWSNTFYQAPYSFAFTVTPLQEAVNSILDNLKVDINGIEYDILSITMQGKDKYLISTIANTIADKFVYTHSMTKKMRRDTILTILEKQLNAAKRDMLNAESSLKKYREQYPTLGMDKAFSTPVELLELKESKAEMQSTIAEGKDLIKRFSLANDTARTGLMSEIVSFLNRYQAATAQGLQTELINLTSETALLKERYSPHHPEVQKNQKNLNILGKKMTDALSVLLTQLERKRDELNNKIISMSKEINNLPSRELEMYNLQRRYDVNSQIYSIVLQKYNEARLAETVLSGDVHVVDHAAPPDVKTDPKVKVLLFTLGFFFSFCAGMGPVLLLDAIKKTVHTTEDLRRLIDLPVLESIPVKGKWLKSTSEVWIDNVDKKIREFQEETYRSLRTKILLKLHDQIPKRLLITSLGTDEGKSFTAIHLGLALSQLEKPTLLIDADLHKGTLHNYLNISGEQGLSEYLSSDRALDADLFKQTVQTTQFPNLCCISNGKHDQNAHYLLNSDRFRCLVDFASTVFEIIIIDTPPFAVVTDALSMQEIVSNYLIVVRSRKTNVAELNKKIGEFSGFREKILGIILNGASYKRMEYYHYTNYRTKKDIKSKI